MKLVFEYDPITGNLTDKNGEYVVATMGLEHRSFENGAVPIETLTKLRNAGFSADEIISLSRKDII